jgi:hypothetical protein
MRSLIVALVTAAVLLGLAGPAPAADRPKEALVDQVKKAIDQGKDYLIKQQTADGNWERDTNTRAYPGGYTALVLLALLNAGVPPDDPAIQKGLKYLRAVPPRHTYVVGLQTMVYCLVGEDKQRIEKNVQWLLDARRMDGNNKLLGWTYDAVTVQKPDNSNMQYALLGLHEAQLAGIKIDPGVWNSIRDYYLNSQVKGGGYGYQFDWGRNAIGQDGQPRFTMTTAGLCGLLIAGSDLNAGREKPLGNGTWQNCGDYLENRAVTSALQWLGQRFPSADRIASEPHLYYALYGIERAGRLTGLRFLGEHDWYRVGCEYLVGQQGNSGSWQSNGDAGGPVVATSFALLFLSKGRTPILISKLTHDGVGRGADGVPRRMKANNDPDKPNDWNNDRNDARHLVEFTSRELFKRQPMGWQVFNAGDTNGPSAEDLAAELLQSPVAYFNGHLAPDFSGTEKVMLRKYVENGGLIFAEACCGSKEFDAGFRALMKDKELFPDLALEPLPPDHPVWTASGKFAVSPKRFPLYGIQMGCKTVVIYSPNDLSCHWESNQYEDTKGDGQTAFRLGANVIAYATGLEPPKPRLTRMEVAPEEPKDRKVPRGFLKVAQLKHEGDSHAAPQAMPNLMRELRQKSGLDVALKTEDIWPTKADVADYKFLYMHGRKSFSVPKDRLGDLRFNLEHGGLLFADACCGSESFDKAFRQLIADLWPDKKDKLERIPLTDALFGKELNGAPIKTVRCRRVNAGKRDVEYQDYEPFLEGVKIKGRWAVIYSKWDLGCALEHTKSPGCMGHDYDSAVLLGRAAVLYHLR